MPTPPVRPLAFLRGKPLCQPNGLPHPDLSGTLASLALGEFRKGELSPQELATFVEALKQVSAQSPEEHPGLYAAAVDEALDLVAGLLGQQPNPVLEEWAVQFNPLVRTDAELQAVLQHFRNTVALYSLVVGLPAP